MAVMVACVGRPGGRVMDMWIDSYTGDEDITCVDHEWVAAQRMPSLATPNKRDDRDLWVASEMVGGEPNSPANRRPLASLHANPAHSAIRRARCFDLALHHLGVTQSRYYPLPWDDRYCEAAAQAAMDASEGYDRACDAAMWSVR